MSATVATVVASEPAIVAINLVSQVSPQQSVIAIATRQLSLTVFVVVVVFITPMLVTKWMAVN